MYYKLGQACVANWGSFVLLKIVVTIFNNNNLLQIGTNWEIGTAQSLSIRGHHDTKCYSSYKFW